MSAVATASTGTARASKFPIVFSVSALMLGVVAGAIFLAFPEIDLMVSRAFYSGDRNFAGQSAFLVVGLRVIFVVVFWLCVVGAAVGLWMTRDRKRYIVACQQTSAAATAAEPCLARFPASSTREAKERVIFCYYLMQFSVGQSCVRQDEVHSVSQGITALWNSTWHSSLYGEFRHEQLILRKTCLIDMLMLTLTP